jgi:hypothetical protein
MSEFQQADFSYRGIEADMGHLQRALEETLRQAGHPLPPGSRRRLLNLACGRADETGVLADLFGKDTKQLDILGADLRAPEIEEARTRWQSAPEAGVHTRFESGDGLRILDDLGADQQFDVAFLRHQNYWNGNDLWQGMFDRSLHRLTEDGMLVITSYFDIEHQQACAALKRLGAIQVANYRNPDSRLISAKHQKSVDRHIAIFRKPNPAS